jgi:hypothetical protein
MILPVSLLLSSLVLADRQLKMALTADNSWTLDVTGYPTIIGPSDAATANGLAWSNIVTVEKTLVGAGPWGLAVKACDYGDVSAFFAAVQVDGANFTSTGSTDTKWTMTNIAPTGDWLNPAFDDSTWAHNYASAPDCITNEWRWVSSAGKLVANMQAQTGLDLHGVWYPNCSSINTDNYFRLVIPALDVPVYNNKCGAVY